MLGTLVRRDRARLRCGRSRGGVGSLARASGLAAGLLAIAASGVLAAPPLLEQMPDNAGVVISIPNPAGLEKNLQALTTAVEIPIPPMGVADLLAMAGFMDGVAADKALGVAILVPSDPNQSMPEDPDEMAVILLPVTDYAAFVAQLDADPANTGDDGVLVAASPTDDTELFVRDLKNGYAALAKKRPVVAGYKPGKKDGITGRAGEAGNALIDSADLVTVVNFDVMRPFVAKAIEKAKAEAAEQLAQMPMGEAPDLESPLLRWVQETVTRDTRMLVGGLKLGSVGVTLEMSASFKPDSYMSKLFAAPGAAGELLKHLPSSQPYLLTLALDTSSPALKQFFKDFAEKVRESAGDGRELPEGLFGAPLGTGDGQATLVGFNPGLIMGAGMLTSTVGYTRTATPDAVVAKIKESIERLNGFEDENITISTKYGPTPKPVGKSQIPADSWQVRMTPQGGNVQAAQGLNWIFGPSGGPSGYIAKASHGVFTTYARNSILLDAAMQAAENGEHLGNDQMIKQVGAVMPKGRVAEFYVGSKSILDLAVPALAMFTGTQIDPAMMPEQVPPVAGAISSGNGEARMTVFVPAPVIKIGAAVGQKFQEARMRSEQMGEDGGKPDPEQAPAGQPAF